MLKIYKTYKGYKHYIDPPKCIHIIFAEEKQKLEGIIRYFPKSDVDFDDGESFGEFNQSETLG